MALCSSFHQAHGKALQPWCATKVLRRWGMLVAARLVPKYFDPQAVAVVEGTVAETTPLLAQS
jgi:hypothetical protein